MEFLVCIICSKGTEPSSHLFMYLSHAPPLKPPKLLPYICSMLFLMTPIINAPKFRTIIVIISVTQAHEHNYKFCRFSPTYINYIDCCGEKNTNQFSCGQPTQAEKPLCKWDGDWWQMGLAYSRLVWRNGRAERSETRAPWFDRRTNLSSLIKELYRQRTSPLWGRRRNKCIGL